MGYHNYFAWLKFGHGRATSDAAHEIRDGHITREEGISLVKKYDGELPKKHFKEFLEYVDLTEEEFFIIADRFRADHLWEMRGNSWNLKKNLFGVNEVSKHTNLKYNTTKFIGQWMQNIFIK